MAERLSRKEKVMGPIPIVASKSRTFFLIKDTWRIEKGKKVVPPRIELGSQEPKSYMLPLHHGTFLKKEIGRHKSQHKIRTERRKKSKHSRGISYMITYDYIRLQTIT